MNYTCINATAMWGQYIAWECVLLQSKLTFTALNQVLKSKVRRDYVFWDINAVVFLWMLSIISYPLDFIPHSTSLCDSLLFLRPVVSNILWCMITTLNFPFKGTHVKGVSNMPCFTGGCQCCMKWSQQSVERVPLTEIRAHSQPPTLLI